MARSPITNLVNQFNSLNEAERALFLDLVDPQAAEPKARKRRGPKSTPTKKGLPSIAGTAAKRSSPSPAPDGPEANTAAETAGASSAASGD